jgi:hypothetical protein
MSDEEITYGRFVTKKKTRPAIVVDCSGWADPADGPITYGRFVTKKKTRPAIEVDCSGWGDAVVELVEVSAQPGGGELHLTSPVTPGEVEAGEVVSERKHRAAEALAALRAAVEAAHAAGIRFVLRKPD